MSEFMSYDPWKNIITRHGYQGDEIISMLQKSIRRGLEKEALEAAYEMYITSPQFEDKLWRRLQVIAVEDIGFGDSSAPILIRSLNEMRKEFLYNEGDRPIFFVYAVRYLCKCRKERSNDYLKTLLIQDFEKEHPFNIPEYALDMHTSRGREMGRDLIHFYQEASKVIPEIENDETKELYNEVLKRTIETTNSLKQTTPDSTVFSLEYISFQS